MYFVKSLLKDYMNCDFSIVNLMKIKKITKS